MTDSRVVGDQSIQSRVARDQLLMVRKNIPTVLFSTAAGAIPLAAVMWSNGFHQVVVVWLALHFLVIGVRAFHHRRFKPETASDSEFTAYRKSSLWLLGIAGGVWGLAGLLFFDPQYVGSYAFLILTLVCMISGSMNATSSLPRAYPLFAFATMLPIILVPLMQPSSFYVLMSIAAAAYFGLTIIFSRNLNHTIRDSLELRYANATLVDDLKVQTELANQANVDKSRFLAAASHDVRQPLQAVNLFADAIEAELTTDKQNYLLGGMRRGLKSASELFDAMLDIASIDTNVTPINKSNFRLEPMLQILIEPLQPEAKGKGLALKLDVEGVVVRTDSTLLERIVGNLLGNALTYTERGSISVFTSTNSDDTISLHIKDSGIGISEEHHDFVFQEFAQIDNAERDRSKGLGLGLAIVQRLTKLLEIPLILKSMPGVGTEFVLRLPLATDDLQAEPEQTHQTQHNRLQDVAVLVVDNEADILEGLKLVLEKWGCIVSCATSVDTALEQVESVKPKIVISDFRMSGKRDGIDLIYLAKSIHSEVQGILVSGDTAKEVHDKARENGLLLLNKPVTPVQLNIALSRMV